jgi:hypothetical protein
LRVEHRCGVTAALAVLAAFAPVLGADQATTSSPFDPTPWLEDLQQARAEISAKYPDLEWEVFEHELDLGPLFAQTRERVSQAHSELEVRSAFDSFARSFGNRHLGFVWSTAASASGSSARQHRTTCESLGYYADMQAAPLAGLMPGFVPLPSGGSAEFTTGTLAVGAQRVGIVKIPLFSPDAFPELCQSALAALNLTLANGCDDACSERIENWTAGRLTSDLESSLRALKAAGIDVLLVDVAGNGGGSEWSEAAARMLTSVELRGIETEFIRGEHWAKRLAGWQQDLQDAARGASGADKAQVLQLAQQVEQRRQQALHPCDARRWLWTDRRG